MFVQEKPTDLKQAKNYFPPKWILVFSMDTTNAIFGAGSAAVIWHPPPLGSWQISRDEQLLTSDYLHRSQVNRVQKAAHPVENLQNSFGMPNFSPTNDF